MPYEWEYGHFILYSPYQKINDAIAGSSVSSLDRVGHLQDAGERHNHAVAHMR
jgi:hypothetical protein